MELSKCAQLIRSYVLQGIYSAGSGHPGGSLSAADLLAYLFTKELSINPTDASDPTRDRFILSKGHACPALYGAFAVRGILTPEEIVGLRKVGRCCQGHPHVLDIPAVETSTGSLGQGFSVSIGMSLALKLKKHPSRVYVMLGDGELQEGEVWEGAMSAAHYKLDNLCAIVDYNKMQSDDLNSNVMGLEPLQEKWQSFGWNVHEINGHDFEEIKSAFESARSEKDRPSIIIAHTIKGKGVSYMEGSPLWHGSVVLQIEELERGLNDLGIDKKQISKLVNQAKEAKCE